MEFTGERFVPGQGGAIELEHLNRYYFVIQQIDLTGKTVLDIASGEGFGSEILAKHADKVIGVDISSETIEHAKNKYLAKNLEFIKGSVVEIPLRDNSVDVVVSFETIEHHDKHQEMMSEIKRVLKKNGILFISTPDKHFYSDISNSKNDFHIKELYLEGFKQLLMNNFTKTFIFYQRTFVGSIIVSYEINQKYKIPIIINNNNETKEIIRTYNIAIACDSLNFEPSCQMVFFKKFDEILSFTDIQTAVHRTKNTKTYKFGRFILSPLKYLRDKIKILNLIVE